MIYLTGRSSRKPRKVLKSETRRQELKKRPPRNKALLTSLLPGSHSAIFFIEPTPISPEVPWTTVGWSLLHPLATKKMFQTLAYRQLPGDGFSGEDPSSLVSLVCVKLTTTNQMNHWTWTQNRRNYPKSNGGESITELKIIRNLGDGSGVQRLPSIHEACWVCSQVLEVGRASVNCGTISTSWVCRTKVLKRCTCWVEEIQK